MGVDLSKLGIPTMAEVNASRGATPKYQMTPAPVVREEKRKAKRLTHKQFRDQVWDHDQQCSRASGKPLVRSHTDPHRIGEVHHVIPRSLAPERIFDVSNGLLLSRYEHALAEAICPNDPAHRLLDIDGPDDRRDPQTFIWRDVNGKELKRRTG